MIGKPMTTNDLIKNPLFVAACKARENSYSPYSHKKVGAAIELADGSIFSGCNVENASFGGTNCAERTAIFKAVSEKKAQAIKLVVVVTDNVDPWPPCGFCRQVIAEFAIHETKVICANLEGQFKEFLFTDLLPESFGPLQMKPS